MKRILLALAFVLGTGIFSLASATSPSQMSDELRSMVLNLKLSDIGLTDSSFPHPVYAVIMETGFPEGSYTLSSVADGSTSLYFSTGGGIIGGGEHQNVRDAASYFLSGAQHFYQNGKLVDEFPKPAVGKVVFYFVSSEGVRAYRALEDDLGNERDELSPLFFAAHNVITELREIEYGAHNK